MAENVVAPVLISVCGPRTFAVAERYGPAQDIYRCRQHVHPPAGDGQLVDGLGRAAAAHQQQVQFTRLAGNADTLPLQISPRRWSLRSITLVSISNSGPETTISLSRSTASRMR